jgi:hypothetical protein
VSRPVTRSTFLAVLALLAWSAPAGAQPISAALHSCSAGKVRLGLAIARAQAAPSVAGAERASAVVKLQLAEAAATARGICQGQAGASVRRQLARALSLYRRGRRAQARRLLAQVLAAVRSAAHSKPAHGASRQRARAASGCSFDGTVHVSMRDAAGVADDLALAAAAQRAGDNRLADEALGSARADFAEWVAEGANGAQSMGDWISIAAAAQWLGDEQLADEALGRARSAARDALNAAEKLDGCSVTASDAPCIVRALTAAMLLGADTPADLEAVKAPLEAALKGGATGCEEWSLSVSIKGANGAGIDWGPAALVVNRTKGTIADAPGVGAGWPGQVPAETGPCEENGVPVGTGSLSAATFHFHVAGKVTSAGFLVEMTSADNHVSISASGPPACQALAGLAELFVNSFLQAPFPVYIQLAPGQTSFSNQETSGEATFQESASRVR